MDKKTARLRRAKRTRRNYIEQGTTRLVIHRTPRHIYAQVVTAEGTVLAAASTVEKAISETVKGTGNVAAAQAVGKAVAERLQLTKASKRLLLIAVALNITAV